MTEQEARLVLSLAPDADREEIIDSYEEAVFEQASFFMRRTFIPKLAEARIKRLTAIAEAGEALKLNIDSTVGLPNFGFKVNNEDGVEGVLSSYTQAETRIKLALANASSASKAMKVYRAWIQAFNDYAKSFLAIADQGEVDKELKLTESPIFTEYHQENAEGKERLVRQEYLRLKRLVDAS